MQIGLDFKCDNCNYTFLINLEIFNQVLSIYSIYSGTIPIQVDFIPDDITLQTHINHPIRLEVRKDMFFFNTLDLEDTLETRHILREIIIGQVESEMKKKGYPIGHLDLEILY